MSNHVECGNGFFNFFKGGHLQKSFGNSGLDYDFLNIMLKGFGLNIMVTIGVSCNKFRAKDLN